MSRRKIVWNLQHRKRVFFRVSFSHINNTQKLFLVQLLSNPLRNRAYFFSSLVAFWSQKTFELTKFFFLLRCFYWMSISIVNKAMQDDKLPHFWERNLFDDRFVSRVYVKRDNSMRQQWSKSDRGLNKNKQILTTRKPKANRGAFSIFGVALTDSCAIVRDVNDFFFLLRLSNRPIASRELYRLSMFTRSRLKLNWDFAIAPLHSNGLFQAQLFSRSTGEAFLRIGTESKNSARAWLMCVNRFLLHSHSINSISSTVCFANL